MRRLRFTALMLGILAGLASAQAPTGTLEGTVLDPSGAVVAGAAVRLVETGTGAERRVHTDEQGHYQALRLSPGRYDISVSHTGFRDQLRRGLELGAHQSARVDFSLLIGATQDQIVVSAEASLLSTSTADWGGSIRREELEALPLNGRDLFDLASQQPGATVPTNADKFLVTGPGAKVSANGARPNQSSFQLDGTYINDASGSAPASAGGRLLGVEGILELRLVTSPFSAEYGRTTGAVFTAVSRSGANDFHGSLYEFLRHSRLDARNFFDAPGEPIPPLRRNQFGGLLSGPMRRDRLFFLVNYEGLRENRTLTFRPSVPTADARQGRLPEGGGVRQIPVAEQVRPYLNLFPLPNGAGYGDGTAEFVTEVGRQTREHYVAGKIDFLASQRLRLAGRYTFDTGRGAEPDYFHVFQFTDQSRYQFVHLEAQYLHSPATIYSFRAGFSRVRNSEVAASSAPPELSYVPGLPLGSLDVNGLASLGDSRARARPRRFVVNHFPFSADAVLMRGPHTLKWGAGYDRVQFNQISDLSAPGRYQFTSLADFLQGLTRSGEVMYPGSDSARGWRQNEFSGYLQDEYRVRRGLTLNLGVRYEAYSTPTEVNGKVATLPDPVRDTTVTVGQALFRNPSWDNFAPRASLAWDPFGSGRTVLRLGGGIFFDLLGVQELTITGMRMPPFFNRLALTRPSFPQLLPAPAGVRPGNALEALDYYLNQPYAAQFQASLEHQLAAGTSFRVGYSGSRGVHLMGYVGNGNPTRPEFQSGGRVFFPANTPRVNPAFDQIGMRRSQFNSFYHALLLGLERRWRNGLRLQANYTWAKSIDETSSALNGEFLNSDRVPTVLHYRLNRGPSDFDMRQVFSANVSYRLLPSGGRKSAAARVLRDWEIHGLTQVRTGPHFNPFVGFDRLRLLPSSGDHGQRPDFIAASGADVILGDPQRYFDPAAFGLPAAGYYGNLGRNVLTGPGLAVLDLALHKTLFEREGQNLRLRLEWFNATNHPNFQLPSEQLALFNSSLAPLGAAGRITATSTSARQMQIAVRYSF